ncbi:hypothetical protein RIF29_14359 [Crotalaria pallida]|uniref:Uncharacterized protein n=1 Tax=Crotalaria pallida TaxID=3830 RepID=A0AAN9IDP4_CROPI
MSRTRGRPPKTRATHHNETNDDDPKRTDVVPFDLQALDDADLDNLSPKKAQQILECIDALRVKIKGKAVEVNTEGDQITRGFIDNQGVHDTPASTEPVIVA